MCPNARRINNTETMLIDYVITSAIVLLIQKKERLHLGQLSLSRKGNQIGFTVSLM